MASQWTPMSATGPGSRDGPPPAWRTCLDFDRQDAGHYRDFVNHRLLGMAREAPRRVLDLGCAAGAFGSALKARFPGAAVTGVEAGEAAARKAAERIDRVIRSRLEALDFASPDLGGPFDTVIAADVLEHLVNPWELLLRLRPALAPGAQLLASIPNVRNIWLVSRLLMEGRWEYTEQGLLDVTHLRFFTRSGMRAMFSETGYGVEAEEASILPSLAQVHASYRGGGAPVIRIGRLTLNDIGPEELLELCAENFLFRARPIAAGA
jgi:SAM-dependent methyltransferase